MKLSKKKKDQLYGAVHRAVMDARIDINKKIEDHLLRSEIDDVMYHLMLYAPDQAVNVFNK